MGVLGAENARVDDTEVGRERIGIEPVNIMSFKAPFRERVANRIQDYQGCNEYIYCKRRVLHPSPVWHSLSDSETTIDPQIGPIDHTTLIAT